MGTAIKYLTIKQAAQQVNKSEQTIRRLVKQQVMTTHVRVERVPKGDTYLISQAFLWQQYPDETAQPPALPEPGPVAELATLQQQLAERDQTIQQLQHRLLALVKSLVQKLSGSLPNVESRGSAGICAKNGG